MVQAALGAELESARAALSRKIQVAAEASVAAAADGGLSAEKAAQISAEQAKKVDALDLDRKRSTPIFTKVVRDLDRSRLGNFGICVC